IFIFGQRVGWRAYVVQQIAQSESAQKRIDQLEPEKRDAAIDQQAGITKWILYISFSVGVFIFAVIVAAVLMLGFMIIAGVRPTFAQSLSIVAYAWIPGVITALLAMLILFLKDPSTVDLNNLVASNIGAFLPEGSAKWLKVLCTSIDIFAFWKMLLMALGFSAVDPKKLSVGKAFAIVFAIYLAWVLAVTGVTAAFS
ncbi:MAG: YIP1 family protein, partial [Candidatus Acidiferrales bacterium]